MKLRIAGKPHNPSVPISHATLPANMATNFALEQFWEFGIRDLIYFRAT